MNRFDKYRETFSEGLCKNFKITKEQLDSAVGVMFDFTNHTVELRDKNYATIAKINTKLPLNETYNVVCFIIEVVGAKSFDDFLAKLHTETGKLEWLEVYSDGFVKASFHARFDFTKTAEGLDVLKL